MTRTYEVFIDVEHHPRHNDDDAKHERTGFKLEDTGQPLEMVADCLRAFADELDPRTIPTTAALQPLEFVLNSPPEVHS